MNSPQGARLPARVGSSRLLCGCIADIGDEAFRFEARADDIAAVHRPTDSGGQFVIERSKPLTLRSFEAGGEPDTPPRVEGVVPIRQSIYAFCVVVFRRLGDRRLGMIGRTGWPTVPEPDTKGLQGGSTVEKSERS